MTLINYPATPKNFKEEWRIGWGPRKGGAPFILLAAGGDYIDGQGGNPAAETLLIVTNNDPNIHTPPTEIPGYHIDYPNSGKYRWGHLECGNITVHGTAKLAGMKSGHAWTSGGGSGDPEALGVRTIYFRDKDGNLDPFKTTPSVTITIQDQNNGENIPYVAKIIDVGLDHFKVQTFVIRDPKHKHHIGWIGNASQRTLFHDSSNNIAAYLSPAFIYHGESDVLDTHATPTPPNEDSVNAGFMAVAASNSSSRDMYTKSFDQLPPGSNAKADSSYFPFWAEFMWTAIERTQPDPPKNSIG